MTSGTLDFESAVRSLPWLQTRAELIKRITTDKALPSVFKTAALALALISDADFARMRDTFIEIIGTMSETPRGRKLLYEMNVDGLLYAARSD